jgi:hypothetical protein
VRAFLEAEQCGLADERKRKAEQLLLESLAALGKHAVRSDELRKRSTGQAEGEDEHVVARIGGEPITVDQLRAEIDRQARMIAGMQAPSPDQVDGIAESMVDGILADQERVKGVLERLVTQRLLYQEGLERGMGTGDELGAVVARFRRDWIAQRVVDEHLRNSVKLTETDLENHLKAHKDDYAEAEAVKLSAASFDTEEAAREALAGGPAGLEQLPIDRSDQWITRSDAIPNVGRSGEVIAHVFSLEQEQWSDRALKVGDKWYLFRVDSRRARRDRGLDEVRDRVESDLAAAKSREAIEALRRQLEGKYTVEMDPAGMSEITQGPDRARAGSPQSENQGDAKDGATGN